MTDQEMTLSARLRGTAHNLAMALDCDDDEHGITLDHDDVQEHIGFLHDLADSAAKLEAGRDAGYRAVLALASRMDAAALEAARVEMDRMGNQPDRDEWIKVNNNAVERIKALEATQPAQEAAAPSADPCGPLEELALAARLGRPPVAWGPASSEAQTTEDPEEVGHLKARLEQALVSATGAERSENLMASEMVDMMEKHQRDCKALAFEIKHLRNERDEARAQIDAMRRANDPDQPAAAELVPDGINLSGGVWVGDRGLEEAARQIKTILQNRAVEGSR